MDKRTLFGGGAAGVIVLMFGAGMWINGNSRPASSLDAPLPPGAVEVKAGEADQPIITSDDVPTPVPEPTLARPEPAASLSPSPAPTPAATQIVVFVSGAVKRPGVYRLKPGARVESAIFAAGGFKPNAQTDLINLADLARDGDHVQVGTRTAPTPAAPRFVPPPSAVRLSAVVAMQPVQKSKPEARGRVLGRPPTSALPATTPSASSGGAEDRADAGGASESSSAKFRNPGDGVVNLNTASAEELQRLPGVGPSMAAKIIAYREEHGPFADISQLDDVKGIGPKTYAKMEPFLSVK